MIKVPEKSTRIFVSCEQTRITPFLPARISRGKYADRARLSNRTWWFAKDTAGACGKAREKGKKNPRLAGRDDSFLFPFFTRRVIRGVKFSQLSKFHRGVTRNARGLNYTCVERKCVNIINHPLHCSEQTRERELKQRGNVISLELR